mgnify:CR=1 FL=1
MKYILIAMLLTLNGWAVYVLLSFNPPQYPEPERVVLYDDRKCLVYEGERHGATLYALICKDGSVVFTTNWMFVKETKE